MRAPLHQRVVKQAERPCPFLLGIGSFAQRQLKRRDAGFHEFDYSIISHKGDFRAANIEKRGREVNNPLAVHELAYSGEGEFGLSHSFMELDATENVIVTAIKKADRDDSIIVRLAETGGMEGRASVSIEGAEKMASTVNFLERLDAPVSGDIALSPFKIVTIRLQSDND